MCVRNGSGVSTSALPEPSRSSVTVTSVSFVFRVTLAERAMRCGYHARAARAKLRGAHRRRRSVNAHARRDASYPLDMDHGVLDGDDDPPPTSRAPDAVDLAPDERARLFERYGRRFSSGDTLYREGDPAREAYLLQEGRVRLLKHVRMIERSLMVL